MKSIIGISLFTEVLNSQSYYGFIIHFLLKRHHLYSIYLHKLCNILRWQCIRACLKNIFSPKVNIKTEEMSRENIENFGKILVLFHIFDLFCTSTHRLYFDRNFTSTCASWPIRSPDLTKGRSTEVEVERSKYRKGVEDMKMVEVQKKVELMRTLKICVQLLI